MQMHRATKYGLKGILQFINISYYACVVKGACFSPQRSNSRVVKGGNQGFGSGF